MKHSRIGETFSTNEGYTIEIIDYNNNKDVTVRFLDDHGFVKKTRYAECRSGKIKNPYHKGICNVGYVGVGEHKTSINGKETPACKRWHGVLRRGFDTRVKEESPTYKDSSVCEEWHNFQNFAKWYDDNYYEVGGEKMELDKDILVKGNKVYSPETCVFVPRTINLLFTKSDKARGNTPIGVCYIKRDNGYRAFCSTNGGHWHSQLFKTEREAFNAYKDFKEQYIKEVAEHYKPYIPTKLYEAMLNYKVEITD